MARLVNGAAGARVLPPDGWSLRYRAMAPAKKPLTKDDVEILLSLVEKVRADQVPLQLAVILATQTLPHVDPKIIAMSFASIMLTAIDAGTMQNIESRGVA